MAVTYYAGFSILDSHVQQQYDTHLTLSVDDGTNSFTITAEDVVADNGSIEHFCHAPVGLAGTESRYDEALSVLSEYAAISFAEALENSLNAQQSTASPGAISETWLVSFDTSALVYTITTTDPLFTFTLDYNSPGSKLTGWGTAETSSAASHTAPNTPFYVIGATVGARSSVTDDYHPSGQMDVAPSEFASPVLGSGRQTAVTYQDWVQAFEPLAMAQREEAASTAPWTWDHMFEYAGGAAFPMLCVYGANPTDNVVCKLRGEPYRPQRVAHDWDEKWNIVLRTVVYGHLYFEGLLDFSTDGAGSMSRSSVATNGIGLLHDETVSSVAANTQRTYDYGGHRYVIIERAETNLALSSEELDDSNWTRSGVQTLDADVSSPVAPDGNTTAETIESTAGGVTGIYQVWAHAGLTDSTDHTASIYYHADDSSSEYGLRLRKKTGGLSSLYVDAATFPDSGWQRAELTTDISTGSSDIQMRVQDHSNKSATTRSNFGAQFEEGSYATSYAPTTSGATATRGNETFDFTNANWPQVMRYRRWAFKFIPFWAHDENHTSDIYLFSTGSGGMTVTYDGSDDKFKLHNSSTLIAATDAVTFAQRTVMTLYVDPSAASLQVVGADSGDSTATGTAFVPDDGTLTVGNLTTNNAADGLVSEPWLA